MGTGHDFSKSVPRDPVENMRFRVAVRRRARIDAEFRKALWTACREDVVFFFSTFCFLYEPRTRFGSDGRILPNIIPFVPWEHQIPVIRECRENLGKGDVGVKKSRGEGASWMGCLFAMHDWIFRPDSTVGMCSSTEDKADKFGDRGSLMGKIDWELSVLPTWMVGKQNQDWVRNKSDHTLLNLRNHSLLVAHAATAGTGRGHRFLWYFLDELAEWNDQDAEDVLASLHHATDSRFFPSTPQGSTGAYYEIMHQPSSMIQVQLWWAENEAKNRGLYRLVGEEPIAVDDANPLADEYNPPSQEVKDRWSRLRVRGFDLTAGPRSPWYDAECDRALATPLSIAQELDMDFGGSEYKIFGTEFFKNANADRRPPRLRGNLDYHPEKIEPDWSESSDGQFHLWCPLDIKGRPERSDYVIGCDVSTGLGGAFTSNSVLTVIDCKTHEQVAEFATNTMAPSDFADVAVATAKWFHNAFLAWEINGPGGAMTKRVQALRYPNIYMREILWKRTKQKTKEPGWWTDRKSKEFLFSELNRIGKTGELRIRSRELVDECGYYVRIGGVIEHRKAKSSKDDSVQGEAHGDRVIALGVAHMAMKDRPVAPVDKGPSMDNPPPYTMAARLREYLDSQESEDSVWDNRTTEEMMYA